MSPLLIVGPCAVESQAQLFSTFAKIKNLFAEKGYAISFFRAGVWKPRSNPNDFTGLGEQALPWLKQLEEEFQVPVCIEVARAAHAEKALNAGLRHFWLGTRTMVNPFLVQELADTLSGAAETVMLKNPMTPDLKLWMGGIERFQKTGTPHIVAIHRGFADANEHVYRNAPLWHIPIELKLRLPELPLVCDVSHLTGHAKYIEKIAQMALDYGFDGLMVETHCSPENALSDAQQQLTPEALTKLLGNLVFKTPMTSPAEEKLRIQRNILHNIDTQIASLLAQRMSVVDVIADIKKQNNLQVVQPQQWNKVVAHYQEHALQDEHFQEFLQKFLELLHQQSVQRQM